VDGSFFFVRKKNPTAEFILEIKRARLRSQLEIDIDRKEMMIDGRALVPWRFSSLFRGTFVDTRKRMAYKWSMDMAGSGKLLLAQFTPMSERLTNIVASYASDADGHGQTRAAEVHPRQK
jgi:hypothetical protein